MSLRGVTLDELAIMDERSFNHIALFEQLKQVVRRSGHQFLVPRDGEAMSWDRALFLNLTFWSSKGAADVLCEPRVPADVVAHVAWHHLAATHLIGDAAPSARALLFAESIASAFDLYLVGRLLPNAPDSDFITTQVPIMTEAAEESGLAVDGFEALLTQVSDDPERAFEDLRTLLLDAGTSLLACREPGEAQLALERLTGHRFEPLLHHYQLSNWILYARAYATPSPEIDAAVDRVDATLRQARDSLAWLAERWISSVTGGAAP